jgi:hypothetical protein
MPAAFFARAAGRPAVKGVLAPGEVFANPASAADAAAFFFADARGCPGMATIAPNETAVAAVRIAQSMRRLLIGSSCGYTRRLVATSGMKTGRSFGVRLLAKMIHSLSPGEKGCQDFCREP